VLWHLALNSSKHQLAGSAVTEVRHQLLPRYAKVIL
jgi:hypothetical protein